MRRTWPALIACVLMTGGCFPYTALRYMQLDLAQELAAGRDEEAARIERRIRTMASEAYGESGVETFRIRTDLAEIYGNWRRTDHALELATSAREEMETLYGPDDERVTAALLAAAKTHLCAHRWKDAELALDRTSRICRQTIARTLAQSNAHDGAQGFAHAGAPPGPPDPAMSSCRFILSLDVAFLYEGAGAYRKAVEESLFADFVSYASNDRCQGPNDRSGAISLLTLLGRRHAKGGEYTEALAYLERCVNELRPHYDRAVAPGQAAWSSPSGDVQLFVEDAAHSFHSQSPRCLEDLIELRRRLGDDETAERLAAWQRELWSRGPDLEAALIERAKFADMAWSDDALTSRYKNNLAFYYAGKGRPLDAIAAYRDGIRLLDRGHGRDQRGGRCSSFLLLDELMGLGAACEEAGRPDEAETAYRRAAEIAAIDLNPVHAWRLQTVARLARVLAKLGRSAEAEQMWRRYLSLARQMRGEDHADTAFGLAGLASTLADAGRTAEARALRARADSIWGEVAGRIATTTDVPFPAALRCPASPAN